MGLKRVSFVAASVFLVTGCGSLVPPTYLSSSAPVTSGTGTSSGGSGTGGSTSGTTSGSSGGSSISFSQVQNQVITPLGCTSCHSQFGAYAGVVGSASAMYSMMAAGSMPPSGGVTTAELQLFQQWISDGAPQ